MKRIVPVFVAILFLGVTCQAYWYVSTEKEKAAALEIATLERNGLPLVE